MNDVIKTAISLVGSQQKLGEACGLTQQSVYKWLHDKAKVSPEHVNHIVKATGGKVQAHEIRPDLPNLFPRPDSDSNAA
ncbi:MAG: helix-turn-helix domain-containing protein [Hafnia sp.]